MLTLVVNFSRESLAIRAGKQLAGDNVVQTVDGVVKLQKAKPASIRVDNGPEFISMSLALWAYCNAAKRDLSRLGKLTDSVFVESFNGKFRVEFQNEHWFMSLDEAQRVFDLWRYDYNRYRPHGSLGNSRVPPIKSAARGFRQFANCRIRILFY
jgi:putative transposase